MREKFKNIRYEIKSRIATVTIDRPERKNAIDIETMLELSEVVQEIEKNSEILVMILTGGGDEVFIGGGDLKYFQTLDSLYKGREMSILCGKLLDRIEGLKFQW